MTDKEVLQERLNYIKTKKVPPFPDDLVGEGRVKTAGAFGMTMWACMLGFVPLMLILTFIVPCFDKSDFAKQFDLMNIVLKGESPTMMIIFLVSLAFALYGIFSFICNILVEQGDDPVYNELYDREARKTLQAYNAVKEEFIQRYAEATREYESTRLERIALSKTKENLSKELTKLLNENRSLRDMTDKLTMANKKKDIKLINQEIEMAKLKSKLELGAEINTEDPMGGLYE